ncbi:hypothetical protein QNE49_001366 [Vibrio fluvialis]|nr:hypothetical protein [Vibrio fluvialis]MBY7782997.1 hypothetical protein [Vibrio fluvialis]
MAKYVFPNPRNAKLKDNAVFCSNERIINLYNQEHSLERVRMTPTIKSWFAKEAKQKGWAGGNFVRDCQTEHSAGCVLFTPPTAAIAVESNQNVLLLPADDGSQD